MKEGIGRALEIFSVIKIYLAIVFHLECAELTKFQEFLKMVLRSKAQKESIIRGVFKTRNGEIAKWRNSEMAKWRNGTKDKSHSYKLLPFH